MAGKTNVFPVLDNKFKVGAEKGTASTIADMETFQFQSQTELKLGLRWIQKVGKEH